MLGDLKSARLIVLKGVLFLVLGVLSAVIVAIELSSWKMVGVLAVAIWAFCRFYYFAFYVLEKYVDSNFRFSGLWSVACAALPSFRSKHRPASERECQGERLHVVKPE